MKQVLPEAHARWVNADLVKKQPRAANEVGQRLVGNDALHTIGVGSFKCACAACCDDLIARMCMWLKRVNVCEGVCVCVCVNKLMDWGISS